MEEFLDIALVFPTVVYSLALGFIVLYWLFVVIGVLDFELLEFDLGDFDADADIDLDVDLDSDVDVNVDLDLEGSGGPGALLRVLHVIGIGRVPLTILLSVALLMAWAISYLGVAFWPTGSVSTAVSILILVASFLLAIPIASLLLHPIKPYFEHTTKRAGNFIVGSMGVVLTGSVDEEFGQARVADGGASLVIAIRCESPNELKKGSKVLVVGWDESTNAYDVEPMDALLSKDGDRQG